MTRAVPKSPGTTAALTDRITPFLTPDETMIAAAALDMDAQGRFCEGILAITDQRLLALHADAGALRIGTDFPLDSIVSVNKKTLQGAFKLDIVSARSNHTVSYYTRAASDTVDTVIEQLQARTADQANDKQERAGVFRPLWNKPHGKVCETCGKPIPHRVGFCPDCLDKGKIYRRLLSLAQPYALPMAGGLLLMLLITFIEMAQPVLTKVLIDRVIPNSDMQLFVWIVIGIIAIQTFSAVFSGTRAYMMAWLGERIVHDLRRRVYSHLQSLSLDFYDQRQTGWLMDRVSADTSNLQNFLGEGFQDLVRDVMIIIVILGIMFAMNWQLALVTMMPAPFVAWMTMQFVKRVRQLFHRMWRRRAYMTSHLSNVIPGVRVVKAFAQEQKESNRFTDASQSFMEASIRTARAFAMFFPFTHFVTSLGFVAVWGFGGYLVITGKGVTLGTLIAFISYLWRFYGPVNNLSRFSQRLERATTSAQRVFDVLDTKPTVVDRTEPIVLEKALGEVVFEQVTFGYESDEPVLKDLSFTVKPGEMIGLVGPSGAGKSTTINLLCRFYDVNDGAIRIDGHDIRDISSDSIHRSIGVVLQEPFLFHGTIGENIAYGMPGASQIDIMVAAKAANAHEFIMKLPDAYDTLVGERGQRLSGGERQRISIARAVLKNPRILILDEATSSVDTETEAAIQQAIERLVQGRTTFAIAHRFSTLRNADRLVVLDEGKLVEIGSHEELLADENGLFRRLVDIQTHTSQIVGVGG